MVVLRLQSLDFGIWIAPHARSLEWLKPVFEGWNQAIVRFAEQTGEAPYYYNERANVSLLSVGAFTCGAIALEEYGTQKQRGKTQSNGRADLYIGVRERSRFREINIEAKQRWPRPNDPLHHFDAALEEACDGADCLIDPSGPCAGAVFYTLVVPLNQQLLGPRPTRTTRVKIVNNSIAWAVGALHAIKPDLLAWSFPPKLRLLTDDKAHYSLTDADPLLPGVLVALRLATGRIARR
jgi:hypothetical protein